ncbi:ankyrin repeat-containing domain protein [Lentinula raphanica]|nr:ankyrin repeat-containing domain protein [Lentinula raphanica]
MSYNLSIEHTESTGIPTHNSILEDTTIFYDSPSNEIVELHKWLATWTPDCAINHSTALGKRAVGTSEWILTTLVYKKWKKEGNFLWLQGKAGSGKTIVIASIIENLKKSNSLGFLAYHYFDLRSNTGEKRSYQGLLLNLLFQLGIQNNKYHSALNSLYLLSKNKHLDFKPTNSKLANIIITITRDIVQRRHQVNTDIDHMIEERLQTIYKAPVFQAEVKKLLLQKVNEGLEIFRFFYIECQLHVLKTSTSRDALKALAQLPSDLKETHIRAIANCKKNIIVSMNLKSSTVPSNVGLLLGLENMVDTTLITVDAQKIVQFAHASVKECLLEIRDNMQMKELYNLNAQLAHNIMAHMCLIYLLQHTHYEDTQSETKFVGKSLRVFKHYATQYWAEHSKYNENSDTPFEDTLTLTQKFLENSPSQFMSWKRNYIYMGDKITSGSKIFRNCHPMHVVAFFGLRNSAQWLITKTIPTQNDTSSVINVLGEMLGTALQTAAFGNQMGMVQLLLRFHADVNIQGGYFGTALQAAISGRSNEITQLLLEHNANVNAEGGYYGTAIQAAASARNKHIIRLLLRHNANPNIQRGYYGTALQAAAFWGHTEIIELLLKKGVAINTLGGIYGSALQAAVAENHQGIIEILLKHNANPNAQGGYFGTALQAAAFWGYKEIIQMLFKYRTDVNMQGGEYGTALQAAVIGKHKTIIQILLDKGADISSQGGYYGTALHAAAFLGYEEILELFIRYGVDVNTQGGEYGTALQAATVNSHKDIIELLLKHGAKINAQGGQHGTALQIAEKNGHEDLIDFLLEHGADVRAHAK